MKLHLRHTSGTYRHACGLKTTRSRDVKYLELWTQDGEVYLPEAYAGGTFTVPIKHVGVLKYGGKKIVPCKGCFDQIKEKKNG
ncbi:unnamed protein product [marine sediment metagenome]|uniref:Uncharacterized protein n=1 Tax=marine sediment metagenome TaxID=412755 RepID=X0TVY2_9ZZZZ